MEYTIEIRIRKEDLDKPFERHGEYRSRYVVTIEQPKTRCKDQN